MSRYVRIIKWYHLNDKLDIQCITLIKTPLAGEKSN